MKHIFTVAAFSLLVLAFCTALVHGQAGGGFELSFSAVTSGGGTASGGILSLNDSIAQPAAGSAGGGAYSLEGGFQGGAEGGPTFTNTPTRTNTPVGTISPQPTNTYLAASTATITATPTTCVLNISDVEPAAWFYQYVRYLYCHGVVNGYHTNPPCDTGIPCFKPDNLTSRGQLAKIAVLAFGFTLNTSGGPHFTDVPIGSTFYDYVEAAYNMGLIAGYFDGTYRPTNNVTRGQLVKIVVNAAIIADPVHWTLQNPPTGTFEDVEYGSSFYMYVETALSHGVIGGYRCGTPPAGLCRPPGNKPYYLTGNSATRAQISKIVYLAVTYPPQ